MKYQAGDKYLRNTLWTRVKFITGRERKKNVHNWCKEQDSDSSFYHHYAGNHWWFESERDAIMFTLKWGKN